jgi:hypothetical protein
MHREPEGRVTLLPRAVQNRKRIFWQCYADDVTAVSPWLTVRKGMELKCRPTGGCARKTAQKGRPLLADCVVAPFAANISQSDCRTIHLALAGRAQGLGLRDYLTSAIFMTSNMKMLTMLNTGSHSRKHLLPLCGRTGPRPTTVGPQNLATADSRHDTRNSLLIGSQLSVDIADLDGDFTHMLQVRRAFRLLSTLTCSGRLWLCCATPTFFFYIDHSSLGRSKMLTR